MSSWKKAAKVNQKVHRERHQPDSRAHLGFLQKKKDYKVRADDYATKQRIIKKLKQKALERNPDEFYFHMINSKVENGVHRELKKKKIGTKEPAEDTEEQKKLMTQRTLGYVAMKRTIETKKIQKLQSELHLIDVANSVPTNHIHFDDEGQARSAEIDTHPSLVNRRINRPQISTLTTKALPAVNPKKLEALTEERNKKYKTLAKMINREKQLDTIHRKMEIGMILSSKKEPARKMIKEGSANQAPIYEFKYQRKR